MAQKKKKKDLKARLGKTISPQGGKGGAVVPPPSVGGAAPASGGVVAPPSIGGAAPASGGIVAPPSIGGAAPGGGVPAPPFGQPQAAAAPQKAADPFSAKAPSAVGPREVRLVIDEKPVDDSEVGRKARGRNFILLGMGLAVGLLVGYGSGSMMSDRNLYNLAVRDGKDIYETVRGASDVVTKAQRFIDTATTAARGGPGKSPAVDYEAIQALQGLEKPLTADTFARKRYGAFQPGTVDALFEYYNNINLLWGKFERVANRSLPEARRAALDEAAAAAQNVATPTGCVPAVVDEQLVCGLVFVGANEEGDGTSLLVRSTITSARTFPKTVYTGNEGEAFAESPGDFVILVHGPRSIGVLGQSASVFGEYASELQSIKALLDSTVELQGRLESELGLIARLEEVFAF